MNNDASLFFSGLIVGWVIVFFVIMAFNPRETVYRKGQIDALTGKVKYERQWQPDSTLIWVEKK